MKCYRPRAYKFPTSLASELTPIVDQHDRVICWAPGKDTAETLTAVIRSHMPEPPPPSESELTAMDLWKRGLGPRPGTKRGYW